MKIFSNLFQFKELNLKNIICNAFVLHYKNETPAAESSILCFRGENETGVVRSFGNFSRYTYVQPHQWKVLACSF